MLGGDFKLIALSLSFGGDPELPNIRFSKPPWPETLLRLFPASLAVIVFEKCTVGLGLDGYGILEMPIAYENAREAGASVEPSSLDSWVERSQVTEDAPTTNLLAKCDLVTVKVVRGGDLQLR